jgi:type I restriction enzyme S subunit
MLRNGLLVDLKDGNHGANHPKKSDYKPTGLPFIAAAHVRDHEIDYDGAPKITGVALAKIRIGHARLGDVIFTHKATIGRVAIADRECILSPQTTYYRVNGQFLLNSYLMRFLESQMAACQYADVVKQTTRDYLPIARQYNLFVPLPPFPEQHRIAAKVEELTALCDRLETSLNTADHARNRLLYALLKEALLPDEEQELVAAE